jgi:hypothetical protein
VADGDGYDGKFSPMKLPNTSLDGTVLRTVRITPSQPRRYRCDDGK